MNSFWVNSHSNQIYKVKGKQDRFIRDNFEIFNLNNNKELNFDDKLIESLIIYGWIKVEFDIHENKWVIFHNEELSKTIVNLISWFEKYLPISSNIIEFVNLSGKSYKTNLIECYNVISFLKSTD